MKRIVIVTLLAVGLCGNAIGMNYLGPPTTKMQAGQWALGGSYADSRQDVEIDGGIVFDNLKEHIGLGRVAVGLVTSRAEIFGMLGAAQLHQGEFKTDTQVLGGLGGRITALPGKVLSWGIVGQFTWFHTEDTSTILGVVQPYELDLQEVQIGLGPCWRPGPFVLYGGPMIQWLGGDIETPLLGKRDVSIESWLGGYVGGGFELDKHLMVTAEFQVTPDALGWSAGAQWRF